MGEPLGLRLSCADDPPMAAHVFALRESVSPRKSVIDCIERSLVRVQSGSNPCSSVGRALNADFRSVFTDYRRAFKRRPVSGREPLKVGYHWFDSNRPDYRADLPLEGRPSLAHGGFSDLRLVFAPGDRHGWRSDASCDINSIFDVPFDSGAQHWLLAVAWFVVERRALRLCICERQD